MGLHSLRLTPARRGACLVPFPALKSWHQRQELKVDLTLVKQKPETRTLFDEARRDQPT